MTDPSTSEAAAPSRAGLGLVTRLRPRLARDAQAYPDRPVIYRRPFLRLAGAGFLVFISSIVVSITFWKVDDGLTSGDWLWPLAFLPTLGAYYLFTTSTLIVNRTHVVINNPLRRACVPLAHVADVVPGRNLKIVTDYKRFAAWGVEAANVQVVTGKFGSQETLRALLLRAAAAAENAAEPPARYRFRWPDPLFIAFLVVSLVCSFGLRLGYGVNG